MNNEHSEKNRTQENIKERINNISSLAFFVGTKEEIGIMIKKLNIMDFEEFHEFKDDAKLEASRSIRFLENKIKIKGEAREKFEKMLSDQEKETELFEFRKRKRINNGNILVEYEKENAKSEMDISELISKDLISEKYKMEICIKDGIGCLIKSLYVFEKDISRNIAQNIIVSLARFGGEMLDDINNQYGVINDG